MNRVAIIGGGAAGLTAAITAAAAGAAVELFEQNNRMGKKILASGNGRCNISNTRLSRDDYYGQDPAFVDYALEQFGFKAFEKFCNSIGLLLDAREDGRTYPLSDEARSVTTALENYAVTLGVVFHCQQGISRIVKESGAFTLYSGETRFQGYDKILVCTGSEAAPQLGGNGDGYAFAESFGHTVLPVYPSLVALELDSKLHHKMAGVKQRAAVTLYVDNKAQKCIEGDILFTRYGISGFAVLDISQSASAALLSHSRVDIGLKLLPRYDRQSLANEIARLCVNLPRHTIETILGGLIASKLALGILTSCRIDTQTPAADISAKTAKQIANAICDWRFSVTDTHGFKHAEVSGGGVCTDEVDPRSMESKLVKGLYFAGEVMDIVGRRGGYNLHFAWASGHLAGKGLSR